MSDTYTVPSSPMATSLRNCAPAILIRAATSPLAISMPTTSSMSAVQRVPPRLRRPFGALSPDTHEADTTVPSGASFIMRPLPSRSFGCPPMIETKIDPDAESTYALSGALTPSDTVHPAVKRAGVELGVFGAASVDAGWFCGGGLQADRPIPRMRTSESRFTSEPPWAFDPAAKLSLLYTECTPARSLQVG